MKSKLALLLLFLIGVFVFVFIYKENKREEFQDINIKIKRYPKNDNIDIQIPKEKEELTFEKALNLIDLKEIKADLEYLASEQLEGRMTGKKGNVLAAKFIKDKFESYNLENMYHEFTENDINKNFSNLNNGPKNEIGDKKSQNIYAWVNGENQNEIIVIGAHMDHIGYGPTASRSKSIAIHPGADDNASGTVALLQLAKVFSKLKPKRMLLFQAYSAEELGLHGSRFYCDNPVFPKNNPSIKSHIFMLNMDMIGYLRQGQHFTGFYHGNSSFDLNQIINQLNDKYNFAKSITSFGGRGSDHFVFISNGIPIINLFTGIHPYYHTPEDVSNKINYDGVYEITKYAAEIIWKVDQMKTKPTFNKNYQFSPDLYKFHDHDFFHSHDHQQ